MKKKKNILFLLTDQQRYDTLSCNGSSQCKTPHIDEIAKEGINFSHAYTPIALCSPSRGSIFTGLYPHNHGQLTNVGDNFNGVFDKNILDKKSNISFSNIFVTQKDNKCFRIIRIYKTFKRLVI